LRQAETLQEIATTQSSTSAVIFDPVRGDGKWDKKNRSSLELCHGVDLPRSEPEAELLPPEAKTQLKRITLLACSF
jgi:hypothetical protein